MAFVKVLDAVKLSAGALHPIVHEGRSIVLCRPAACDRVYAVSGDCPHAGGPLAHGALHGYTIACPWHVWEFDCRTGACDFNESKLDTFPVRIEGDAVWIDFK